ncbi:MAG TPA: hypothetical protein VGM99_00250 [Candidatus Cybelea sp.]
MMRLLLKASVAKEPKYPKQNEDALRISLSSGAIALSDGASESFDSRRWAKLLVTMFIRNPTISPQWLEDAVLAYSAVCDLSALTWSQAAAYERGTYATLIGIRYSAASRELHVSAVGDSICALAGKASAVRTFPYDDPKQFGQRPELLSTLRRYNEGLVASGALGSQVTWDLRGLITPVLICMTDALGEWFLKSEASGEDAIAQLAACKTESDFTALVLHLRSTGRIKVDDTTVAIVELP